MGDLTGKEISIYINNVCVNAPIILNIPARMLNRPPRILDFEGRCINQQDVDDFNAWIGKKQKEFHDEHIAPLLITVNDWLNFKYMSTRCKVGNRKTRYQKVRRKK